jgi:hypothetical protein
MPEHVGVHGKLEVGEFASGAARSHPRRRRGGAGAFVEMTERTSPASLHDRRAARRIEIALAEVDAALKICGVP